MLSRWHARVTASLSLVVIASAHAAPSARPAPTLRRPAPGEIIPAGPPLQRPLPGGKRPRTVRPSLYGLAVDGKNALFIADNISHRVYRLEPTTGACILIAGTGERGFSGDGGPGVSAQLSFPTGVAVDSNGNVFIADTSNNRVRRVEAETGIITTVAGNGEAAYSGDGGPAVEAALNVPNGVAVDSAEHLYIADTNNQRVRVVDLGTGLIRTVAGNGYSGYLGDTGRATRANLQRPTSLAVDATGNLYISDTNNSRVRRVDVETGIITRYAGSWPRQELGDNGPAHRARLNSPAGVALDKEGNLYVADGFHHRVRRVDAQTAIITTVAGRGIQGSDGDNRPAIQAGIGRPAGIAVDRDGNVYVVDTSGSRLRRIDAHTGIITTVPVPAPVRPEPIAAQPGGGT